MRSVLVTGASRGIGKAIASEFEIQNWRVVAPSREELDLNDSGSIEKWCGANRGDSINALVNNAGINFLSPLSEISEPDWEMMLRVNLTAPRRLIQILAPSMVGRGWGRIVNISSIFSIVSRERRAAYSATKAAVNSLARTAAIEFGPGGVLVNAVCPGYVETDMTTINNSSVEIEAIARSIPLRRLAKPEEIAKVVCYLCSESNSYITGQTIIADGGFTCQ